MGDVELRELLFDERKKAIEAFKKDWDATEFDDADTEDWQKFNEHKRSFEGGFVRGWLASVEAKYKEQTK